MMQPRKSVQEMQAYSPPTQGRGSAVRLDFNENTVGCSPLVTFAVAQVLSANSVAMYPEYSSAREIISSFFKVDSEQMAVTNGTDEAIQLLVNTFMDAGDELVITSPSYAMYRFYAEVSGVVVKEVNLPASRQFVISNEGIAGGDNSFDQGSVHCESEQSNRWGYFNSRNSSYFGCCTKRHGAY
jgi:histidinol-phosphate aminotransferase